MELQVRTRQRSPHDLREWESGDKKRFEALIRECGGSARLLDEGSGDHGLGVSITDYLVEFGPSQLICELRSIDSDQVSQKRQWFEDDLRSRLERALQPPSDGVYVFTDGHWRAWIENRKITNESRFLKQLTNFVIQNLPNVAEGERKIEYESSFGPIGLSLTRAKTVEVYVSEFERNDLGERIRSVLGKKRKQHRDSSYSNLPFIVALFLRDRWDRIEAVRTALYGDTSIKIGFPVQPSTERPQVLSQELVNGFFSPGKNTSVNGVLYIPSGNNWSNSPITILWHPWVLHFDACRWFRGERLDHYPSSPPAILH